MMEGIYSRRKHLGTKGECKRDLVERFEEEYREESRWARKEDHCYESPKKEQVSHVFKHLVANTKLYNTDKI